MAELSVHFDLRGAVRDDGYATANASSTTAESLELREGNGAGEGREKGGMGRGGAGGRVGRVHVHEGTESAGGGCGMGAGEVAAWR